MDRASKSFNILVCAVVIVLGANEHREQPLLLLVKLSFQWSYLWGHRSMGLIQLPRYVAMGRNSVALELHRGERAENKRNSLRPFMTRESRHLPGHGIWLVQMLPSQSIARL